MERCRLVLVLGESQIGQFDDARLRAALGAGDVASIIVPPYGLGEAAYGELLAGVIAARGTHDTAVMAVDDTRAAGRSGADGIHVTGSLDVVADVVGKFSPGMIVGCGNANTRHEALQRGDAGVDYIFFGRFGYDTQPHPHPKNLEIATWWAQMVEIPCIVMGGNDVETIGEAAATGADFVSLSSAVFDGNDDAAAVVARANEILAGFPLTVG